MKTTETMRFETPTRSVTVRLQFETSNAAFDGLEEATQGLNLESMQIQSESGYTDGTLKDLNGNSVGKWRTLDIRGAK